MSFWFFRARDRARPTVRRPQHWEFSRTVENVLVDFGYLLSPAMVDFVREMVWEQGVHSVNKKVWEGFLCEHDVCRSFFNGGKRGERGSAERRRCDPA